MTISLPAIGENVPVVDQLDILRAIMPLLDSATARAFLAKKYLGGEAEVGEKLQRIRSYEASIDVAEDEGADRAREQRESSELGARIEAHLVSGRRKVRRLMGLFEERGESSQARAVGTAFGFSSKLRPDRQADAAQLLSRHVRGYKKFVASLSASGVTEGFMDEARDLLTLLPIQTEELLDESAEAELATAERDAQERVALTALNSLIETVEVYAAESGDLAARLSSALDKFAAVLKAQPL
jgi:hypothetical protein